jgi:hypothetical protein
LPDHRGDFKSAGDKTANDQSASDRRSDPAAFHLVRAVVEAKKTGERRRSPEGLMGVNESAGLARIRIPPFTQKPVNGAFSTARSGETSDCMMTEVTRSSTVSAG